MSRSAWSVFAYCLFGTLCHFYNLIPVCIAHGSVKLSFDFFIWNKYISFIIRKITQMNQQRQDIIPDKDFVLYI